MFFGIQITHSWKRQKISDHGLDVHVELSSAETNGSIPDECALNN
jgi:hypothetical protein